MDEKFTASVQYDDWKGTVAADIADDLFIQTYFQEKGVPENGFVVAIRAHYSSISADNIGVHAIYADADAEGYDNVKERIDAADVLTFKKLEIDIPLMEFFSLFKRLNIVLLNRGLDLDDRDYKIEDG